ncbi:MAG: LTA synthase family protein, partial [Pseudomonadota bacterium]
FVDHESPVGQFFEAFDSLDSEVVLLNEDHKKTASQFGIHWNPRAKHPLVSESIYASPEEAFVPLIETIADSQFNLIVLYAEGLSARLVNGYDETFPNLTPNLKKFGDLSLSFDGYFNHTFATYRGLHGQLCSVYPFFGGIGGWHTNYLNLKSVDYFCLPELFHKRGYESVFLDTHQKDAAFIDEMMLELGFSSVLTSEDMQAKQYVGTPKRRDSMSDAQLYTSLIKWLQDRENSQTEPLFLGMYNLETHAWQRISDDGTPYPERDNYILDAVHNYDVQFGRFLEYFQSSKWFDNTVVIVTADHAHYPDQDYRRLLLRDPDYVPVFVDEIPLMIYVPGLPGGLRFAVDDRTSVDFAPTVAQLFSLDNVRNPFWGTSLLARYPEVGDRVGVAAGGDEMYLIQEGRVLPEREYKQKNASPRLLLDFVRKSWELERLNLIWPSQSD